MGAKKPRFPRKPSRILTVAMQAESLRAAFPASRVTYNKNIALTWVDQLQPTPLSEVYKVKIKYRRGNRPEVSVLEPQLRARDGEAIPHVFKGEELCLFRYKYDEWDPTMFIAVTIVPWTALWLLHYEIWRVTGEWCGANQEHPSDSEEKVDTG